MKKTLTFILISGLFLISINSQATPYDQANWYFTVDVDQVRSKIVPLIPEHKEAQQDVSIQDVVPTEVKHITAYGHSEQEDDLTLYISGDFSSLTINEYITGLMYLVEDKGDFSVGVAQSYTHNGVLIEEYEIKADSKSKSFFTTQLDASTVVFSVAEAEVKNWIDGAYAGYDLSSSGMVSVLVNIESALAHMGADLKTNSKSFNSAVFKKITQFSASVYESGENLNLDAALSTADEATAKQLEQVVNGLIAMNALSNMNEEKPVLAEIMSALTISNQGKDLLISTGFAMSLIPEIDFD